ncbi:DUF2158 domain-containing protein [Enterobacter roggenkampii]|uniref:DUF2158 domain-containing protein n=1 Tax=Enterobacter roggenkampii TaxID=1812935 RepID=UPI00388FD20D
MEPKFSVGSKVKLNVGGPDMSVSHINKNYDSETKKLVFNGTVDCQWFAGKKLETGTFRQETLVEVK